MYRSTKTYDHSVGLSACFRQWKALSHCRLLHGYALAFIFVFEAEKLNDRNWVIDFGNLDHLKEQLKSTFDHKLCIAQDDPERDHLFMLHQRGLADPIILADVGCESFARLGWRYADHAVELIGEKPRVRVVSCEVREHGGNSGIYIRE